MESDSIQFTELPPLSGLSEGEGSLVRTPCPGTLRPRLQRIFLYTQPDGGSEDAGSNCVAHSPHDFLSLTLCGRIPLDVFVYIIGHMDRSALPTAALVCWAWHRCALRSLYATVELNSRASYDLLVEQFRTSSRVKQRLTATRILVVDSYDTKQGSAPFLDALPAVFVNTLPMLRVLDIRQALRPVMHQTFYIALHQFKHLVSLRVSAVTLRSTDQLQRIVNAFPQLEALALSNVAFMRYHSTSRRSRYPPQTRSNLHLKELGLHVDDSQVSTDPVGALEHISHWLESSGIHLHILTADISPASANDHAFACEQVDRLLGASGSYLTTFSSRFGGRIRHPREFCNLVHNTALQTLKLTLAFEPNDADRSTLATELYATLSTVRSYQLKRIVIVFYVGLQLDDGLHTVKLNRSHAALVMKWYGLHEIMGYPYYAILRDVDVRMDVVYNRRGHSQEWVDDIARALVPELQQLFMPWHARGIVNISYTLRGVGLANKQDPRVILNHSCVRS
ncbi:uncharacterized protein B0H18DRAFT_1005691 [Fomitopsis serialis]|uniref:uncharacterized protein n=1 Tax=Fomitopsis serialis TaxID=139415 RepID=UPI002008279E|nr:uncharacterized protein B0H18DRAFT_1005691 [Neoantrodia serialis]KAH9926810.1 hypothetical protein B0H18DRAFT_1005691 [Neoantrodia serialis]